MAKAVRLSPPLMFTFREAFRVKDARAREDKRDPHGARVLATRRSLRAAVTEPQLRAQLSRDLETLLNTTNFASTVDLTGFDAVRRSIVNFGVPDIVHRTIEDSGTDNIAGEIETAVTTYEPRMLRNTVRVRRDDAADLGAHEIRFIVTGDMACDPVATPIQFVADLEVVSGKLAVEKK